MGHSYRSARLSLRTDEEKNMIPLSTVEAVTLVSLLSSFFFVVICPLCGSLAMVIPHQDKCWGVPRIGSCYVTV